VILHIALRIILVIAMCFVSSAFWQLLKRDRFLKQTMRDQHCLEGFISWDALKDAPLRIAPYLERCEMGYFINIASVVRADRSALRRAKILFTFLLILILVCTYFAGMLFILINCIIFLLFVLPPLSQAGQHSALEQVLTLALILHKWRSENSEECDQWIEQASSLRPLYNVVKIAESSDETRNHRINTDK